MTSHKLLASQFKIEFNVQAQIRSLYSVIVVMLIFWTTLNKIMATI